ncbi:hypothetical protein JMJ77_0005853, partial [Colletotrichum scovillei]
MRSDSLLRADQDGGEGESAEVPSRSVPNGCHG